MDTELRGNLGMGNCEGWERDSGPVLSAASKWFQEVVFHKAEYLVHSVLKSTLFEDWVLIMEKKCRFRKKKSRRSQCPSFD